jgi:hypothetical protein
MKKKILTLAFLALFAVICNVVFASAFSGENQAFSIYDNVNQLTDWTVRSADLHNGLLRLRWNGAYAERSFTPTGGRVVWEVEIKPLFANGTGFEVELFGGTSLAASMGVNSSLAVSFGGTASNATLSLNQTYTLRTVLDMSAGTADYYLTGSGMPVGTGNGSDWSSTYVVYDVPLLTSELQSLDQMRVSVIGQYEVSVGRVSLSEIPRVPSQHPRLYVDSGDLSDVRSKVSAAPSLYTQVTASLSKTVANCTNNGTGLVYESGSNFLMRKHIENIAFSYLITSDVATGTKAIEMAKTFLDKTRFESEYSKVYFLSDTIHMAAIVYDWCYDRFANEAARSEYLSILRRRMAEMEIKHPVTGPSSITSHASGSQFLRTMLGVGVAVYNESQEVYDFSASRIISQYVPARDFFSKSGFSNMGTDYGSARYAADMYANYIFRAMGYDNLMNETQRLIPYANIYGRKSDGTYVHDGDMYSDRYSIKGDYWKHPLSVGLAAGYYRDPFLVGEFTKQWQLRNDSDPETSAALSLLLYNFSDKGVSSSLLPLTKYFASPNASIIARTGWGNNAAVAYMKMGGYQLNNHQHLDAGQFQLYYKGALAVDSGLYEWDGGGGYYTTHDVNYHKRTIAHNALLIRDASQQYANFNAGYTAGTISNDGGQLFAAQGREPSSLQEILFGERKTSEVEAHAFGPDGMSPAYSYIKGDLTDAYDTSRVTGYKRAMFFLNLGEADRPGALIVFDRATSANSAYKKYWLLHTMNEPVVDGNRIVAVNGGKLTDTALYPESPVIEKVGGANSKFDVFGTNYNQGGSIVTSSQRPYEEGSWRVQISPPQEALEDMFLNVLEMTDAGTEGSQVQRIESDTVLGAMVRGNAITFSKSGNKLQNVVTFTVPASAKCYVTDLEAGVWKVYVNNAYLTSISTTAEGGVGEFILPTAAVVRVEREGSESLNSPKGLKTAAVSGTSAYLLWNEVNGENPVYNIYADGVLKGTTEDNVYLIGGLKSCTSNNITVEAVSGGDTAESTVLTVKTLREQTDIYAVGDDLVIDWDVLGGDTGYDLMIDSKTYYSVTPPFTPPANDNITALSEHKIYLKRKPGDFSSVINYSNFYDDFNSGVLGKWERYVYTNVDSTLRGTANFGVSPDGKKSYVMTDTDYDPTDSYRSAVRMLRGFNNMTGKFMLETRFMLEKAEGYDTSSLGIGIFGTSGTSSKQAARLNVFSDGTLGGYMGYNSGAAQFRIPGSANTPVVAEHEWITLRLFFDVDMQTYDIVAQSNIYKGWDGDVFDGASFDKNKGLFIMKDIPFYTETTNPIFTPNYFTVLNAVDFMQQRYKGTYYIDYVKLVDLPESGDDLQTYGYIYDNTSSNAVIRIHGDNFADIHAGSFMGAAAVYENGKLVDIVMSHAQLDIGESGVYTMDIPESWNRDNIKVFFWRDGSMVPLMENWYYSGIESQ